MSVNYDNYLNMLMRNYPLASDSSEEAKEFRHLKIKDGKMIKNKKTKSKKTKSKIMKGGNKDTDTDTDTGSISSESIASSESESGITQGDVPFGGFPPIFLCKTSVELKDAEKKEREYIKKTTAVSIQDIMKKRRDVVPFLNI